MAFEDGSALGLAEADEAGIRPPDERGGAIAGGAGTACAVDTVAETESGAAATTGAVVAGVGAGGCAAVAGFAESEGAVATPSDEGAVVAPPSEVGGAPKPKA